MKVSQKKDIHLVFNLDDERQSKALEIFIAQSTPRKRTEFVANAILAYQNNAEIARMVASEIIRNSGGTRHPIAKSASVTPAGKTGRPRGRPPKQRPALPQTPPPTENSLSSATQASGMSTQPLRQADKDNQDLLKEIMESFG